MVHTNDIIFRLIYSKGTNQLVTNSLSIQPLTAPVMVQKSVQFQITSKSNHGLLSWDFGDGTSATGDMVKHIFKEPGIYTVRLYSTKDYKIQEHSKSIIRVHTKETVNLPQVFLDTDARCEADDQHFIAYCLYSGLDVLGINSIHNNEPGSQSINYGEIFNIMKLMNYSGTKWDALPLHRVYRGADHKLEVPQSGNWKDTKPYVTEASKAILAAARGANPENPVWIVPVGPCTNIASAVLMAKEEGFNLEERIRVFWLGGVEKGFSREYNGANDPWSAYVMGQSGLKLRILLGHPTSLKLNIDKFNS